MHCVHLRLRYSKQAITHLLPPGAVHRAARSLLPHLGISSVNYARSVLYLPRRQSVVPTCVRVALLEKLDPAKTIFAYVSLIIDRAECQFYCRA